MACAYIPVCLAIFTTCLGTIADVYFRLMALNSDSAHLEGLDLTLSELSAMDEDGDGKVSELEFTKFMLLAMGKLDKEMLDSIEVSDSKSAARESSDSLISVKSDGSTKKKKKKK